MKSTFSSVLAAVAVAAIGLASTAQSADTDVNPDTQSIHARVSREPGKGLPADAGYARAKEKCNAKSGEAKTACLDDAKAAYRREKLADETAAAAISREKVQK